MKIKLISVLGMCFILLLNSCNNEMLDSKIARQEEMVVTPFGPVPKSKAFLIEEGYTTVVENNHLLKIESKTGRTVQDLGEINPLGKSNSGARAEGVDPFSVSGNDVLVVDNSAPINSDDYYSSFTSHIVVPPAPAQNTETIFIGNRMWVFDDIQVELVAALQYGPSAAGGGQNWGAASWKRTASGIVTYSSVVQNLTPGSSQLIQIAYSGNSYEAYIGLSNPQYYIPTPSTLPRSDIYLFLAGSPLSTGSYPVQFSANLTGINVIKYENGTYSYPTVTWSGTTSSSKGEHLKVVNTVSPNGEVDVCFYGTPSNLYYPNDTVYPLTLTWNQTYNAISYEISYYVIDHTGHQTNFSGTSTTSPYTFPFNNTYCRGCDLISKVRANYSGGVVSDWSASFNTMLP